MKHFFLLAAALCLLPVAALADIHIVRGPYLQNVGADEATVVWEADNESVGWVELAPDDGSQYYQQARPRYHDTKNGVKRITRLHTVKLKGLKPGTSYRYRVYCQEVLGRKDIIIYYGDICTLYHPYFYTLKTLDPQAPKASFAMLTDIHGRKGLITPLLEQADWKSKDMIIYGGDMVSKLTSADTIFSGFMDESIKLFAREKPFFYVRGNHETRGDFATRLQEYFCPLEPHLYYTAQHGPVFFIFLDCGEDKADTDNEYYGINDYDQYRTEEAEWLRTVISSPEYKRAKYHVAVMHVPPVKELPWHGTLDLKRKIVPVLNEGGVDVMLCGHYHIFRCYEPDSEVHFPVVVDGADQCLTGEATAESLKLRIVEKDGKEIFNREFRK